MEGQRRGETPLFWLTLAMAAHFGISADIVSEILEGPLRGWGMEKCNIWGDS